VPEVSIAPAETAAAREGPALAVRKAVMGDVPQLLRLINSYAGQGIMLPRTEFEMAENLRDFTVVTADGALAGCGALHLYTPTSGEIRSLAVAGEFQKCGAGRRLIAALEAEARALGLENVFAFTYIPAFFEKLAYKEIERGELPLKAWKDCLRCPKFQCCDETAVIKWVCARGTRGSGTPIGGFAESGGGTGGEPARLPVVRSTH
jgi:amino-acid N-acetyltransferase